MRLFVFPDADKEPVRLRSVLKSYPEIKFISLLGVDFGNHHTDEKIPVSSVIEDLDQFLTYGIQTDGSSNHLPKIATINNAKVDLIPDCNAMWLVDYNRDLMVEDQEYCATLQIPAFLKHNNKFVGSRSILAKAIEQFQSGIMHIVSKYPHLLDDIADHVAPSDLEKIHVTAATELEFWVNTPNSIAEIEQLTTSQSLKEQYWKRTIGEVRTALERSLLVLGSYGMKPEMGHKEVGGVSPQLTGKNNHIHAMEQLEVDWKYDNAMRTADKELYVKDIIKDVFESCGLTITYDAKPIEGVAGSGEHHHLGISATLVDQSMINLFHAKKPEQHFMSRIGYGFLMGMLRGYELINPFISFTTDSFKRLKPGFEAPICVVSSLGHSPDKPSRNRTILIGLVRELGNKYATRFELRSPNPASNSYLLMAACLQFALDAIEKVAISGKSLEEIESGFSKAYGEDHFYLEKYRVYRTEVNVFDDFTEEERQRFFGTAPATVFENLNAFNEFPHLVSILKKGEVFTDNIIASYKEYMLSEWSIELIERIIPNHLQTIRALHPLNEYHHNQLDQLQWEDIQQQKIDLMKDNVNHQSLFSKIKQAIQSGQYKKASDLEKEMNSRMNQLLASYATYKKNLV